MLAILGATGYTGRLITEEARRAGVPLRLVGRRREALEELARVGEEIGRGSVPGGRLRTSRGRDRRRRALSRHYRRTGIHPARV